MAIEGGGDLPRLVGGDPTWRDSFMARYVYENGGVGF